MQTCKEERAAGMRPGAGPQGSLLRRSCLRRHREDRREGVALLNLGKSKGGLSKRGLSPKGANWAQKGPFGGISGASRGCEVRRNRSRSAPKRPRWTLKRLQSGPKRPDFPGRIFARFSLKIWGLSPRL